MENFQKNYISDKELAATIGVKTNTLAKWRMKNSKGPKFPYVKIGRSIYYKSEAIEGWVYNNEKTTTKD